MIINYDLVSKNSTHDSVKGDEEEKLNFLLTNSKGDFLNFGAKKNTCKFQGLNIAHPKTQEIYKFIDELVPNNRLHVERIDYHGPVITRKYRKITRENITVSVGEKPNVDHTFGSKGDLKYDENGVLKEDVRINMEIEPEDSFFLGPTGGMIYSTQNFDGNVFVDLDMRKQNDFSEFGRNYKTYKQKGIIFVEFQKEGEPQKMFLGIKADNVKFHILQEWPKKDYEYSKARNSDSIRYVYRAVKMKIDGDKKVFFGTGFTKEEALEEIKLLESHGEKLLEIEATNYKQITQTDSFEKPLTDDIDSAYKLSKFAMNNFLNKDLPNFENTCYAGFPWFSDVWSRDDIISIRALINMGYYDTVKAKIEYYSEKLDKETGGIPILLTKDSNRSCDALMYLAKRIEDFLFELHSKEMIAEIYSDEELERLYRKIYRAFGKVANTNWDFDKELIKVKFADNWMDTIHRDYPVEMQALFLQFVSFMAFFSQILTFKDDTMKFLDLEDGVRSHIQTSFFRDGNLYEQPEDHTITSNVFLCYYLYPNLFTHEDWERIFDSALKVLVSPWGGISSLSKKDPNFRESYTGETNESYHQGDCWFWSSNIAAIVLDDLNEKKYRDVINKIVKSSTNDILKQGTIGYASEVSSFNQMKAEGAQAQLWSNSTYIELVDKVFGKK